MTTFTGRDCTIRWKEYVEAPGDDLQNEKQYRVEFTCASGTVVKFVGANENYGTDAVDGYRLYQCSLTYEENSAHGLTRSPTVNVYTQDAWGDFTTAPPLAVSANNPQTTFDNGAPSITSTEVGATIKFVKPSDKDFAGVLVYMDTANPPTIDAAHLVYDGTSTNFSISIPDQVARYFKVAPYDAFGQDSLTFSSVLTATKTASSGPQGAPGANAVSALLTNESVTVAADSSGTVASFSSAGGTFRVFDGTTEKTTSGSVTYSVASSTGVTISITTAGVYSVSAMSADSGTATLRSVYNGTTIDKQYNIAKSKAGTAGTAGANAKLLTVISDRQTISYNTTGAATPTTQTTTFTAVKQNSTATVSWSITDASGTLMTPTTTYLSAATGDSVTMTEAQFASARDGTSGVIVTGSMTDGTTFTDKISVTRVQDGAQGIQGIQGIQGPTGYNSAVVALYQRSASVPSVPSVVTTYTFSSGALASINNGWSQTVPATNGNPLYVTTATAANTTATDTIAASEWATPTIMAQDGTAGTAGANATNNAAVYLYQRSATQPSVPSVTTTYTFSTGVLASINNGWVQTAPAANGNPLWFTAATALSAGTTDTIANTEWAAPVQIADATTNPSTAPNRIRFSMMERGTVGWSTPETSGATNGLTWGNTNGTNFIGNGGTFTAANQTLSLGTNLSVAYTAIPVTPGERIYFGAGLGISGTATGASWSLAIGWLNSSNVETGSRWTVASGTGFLSYGTVKGGFFTVPAGIFSCFIRIAAQNFSTGTGTIGINLTQPILCSAGANQATAPAFNPGPGGDAGATLGADLSSNVTNNTVDYLIDGVTYGRTLRTRLNSGRPTIDFSESSIHANTNLTYNTYVGLGQNVVQNSDFTQMGNLIYGWTGAWSGNVGNGVASWSYNLPGTPNWYGVTNVAFSTHSYNGTAGQGGLWDGHTHLPVVPGNPIALTDLQRWALPVYDGDRVFASCLLAHHRCTAEVHVTYYDSTGSYITEVGGGAQGRDGGASLGDPANFDRATFFGNVPTGARYARMNVRATTTDGQANPYIFYTQMMLCKVAAGQTVAPPYTPGILNYAPALGYAGSGVRIGDSRNLPAISGAGARYKYTGSISYSATAGSGTATISVTAGASYIGSNTINYNALSVGVSGTVGATTTYLLYFDDPNYTGGSQTLVATTNGDLVYQNDGRVWIGSVDVTFPTSGSGTSTGGGTGGGGCVASWSWVETENRGWVQAGEIVAGDMLRCLNEDGTGTIWLPVRSNYIRVEPVWQIKSKSGVTVCASDSTPVTLRDGSGLFITEVNGHELPLYVDGKFYWERCWAKHIKTAPVCYISLGGYVYAAGDEQGRSILTHNPLQTYQKP